jgi:hypothetical protein
LGHRFFTIYFLFEPQPFSIDQSHSSGSYFSQLPTTNFSNRISAHMKF